MESEIWKYLIEAKINTMPFISGSKGSSKFSLMLNYFRLMKQKYPSIATTEEEFIESMRKDGFCIVDINK